MKLNKKIKLFFVLILFLNSCQTRNERECKKSIEKYVPANLEMFDYYFGKSENEFSEFFFANDVLPDPTTYFSDRASGMHCKYYADTSFFFSTAKYIQKNFYLNIYLMDGFYAFKRFFLAHVYLYYNTIYQNLNDKEQDCFDSNKILHSFLTDVSSGWGYIHNLNGAQYLEEFFSEIEELNDHDKVMLMIFFMLDGLEFTAIKYSKQEQEKTGLPEDLFYMRYGISSMNCEQ